MKFYKFLRRKFIPIIACSMFIHFGFVIYFA